MQVEPCKKYCAHIAYQVTFLYHILCHEVSLLVVCTLQVILLRVNFWILSARQVMTRRYIQCPKNSQACTLQANLGWTDPATDTVLTAEVDMHTQKATSIGLLTSRLWSSQDKHMNTSVTLWLLMATFVPMIPVGIIITKNATKGQFIV